MTYKRLSRVAGLLAAAVVAVVTFAVSAHAVLTITTPNAFTSTYSLGTGGNGPTITPPANEPVFVMGDETMAGDVGSSDMTVVNSVGQDKERTGMEWPRERWRRSHIELRHNPGDAHNLH